MNALRREDVDGALTLVDREHDQLLRDRATLAVVEQVIGDLDARLTMEGPRRTNLEW